MTGIVRYRNAKLSHLFQTPIYYGCPNKTKSLLESSWDKKICPEDISSDLCWVRIMKYHPRQARKHCHGPIWGQKKANQNGIVVPEKKKSIASNTAPEKCRLTGNYYHLINEKEAVPVIYQAFPNISEIYSLTVQKHSGALETSYIHLKRKDRISAWPSSSALRGTPSTEEWRSPSLVG